ncbi:MAG: tripartite tricarboxylate transporter TctB family protein, partial [Acidobacteriota bacterium]
RESGIALDLANWRAIVAPPGLSDLEQAALTKRLTTLTQSPPWRDALTKNGWQDQFLAGTPFRQFLLAEQSRIDAVLQRLNATDIAPPAALAITLTPNTLPSMIGGLFLIALTLTTMQTFREPPRFDRAGSRMAFAIISTLVILPLIFVTAGFIASSTLLFTASAAALRGQRPSARHLACDIIVGGLFSIVLFILFTRGLGVSLPGPSFR